MIILTRAVRAVLPLVVLALWWVGLLPAWAAIPLGVLTVMLFPAASTGACSIYYALGCSTCLSRPEPARPVR